MKSGKDTDSKFMNIALELAAKGKGKTNPNPMVGAVVIRKGQIVGSGYHKKAGQPHAEIYALTKAGIKAKGSTLYVTLEPCSTYGRTPPCTEAIAKAGIKRVVIAASDPNPINHNKGIRFLRRKGIRVETGLLRDKAERLNTAYNKFICTKIPFVTIKVAMSLDGKIATKTGSSKWISGKNSRTAAHRLRKKFDAVVVGRNTFLKDKPRFRDVKCRVVLGRPNKNTKAKNEFISSGKWLFWYGGKNLKTALKKLGERGIMSVLIEGGGEIIASAIEEGIADRLYLFIAPKIIGGRTAKSPVEGRGIKDISQAIKVKGAKVDFIGKDILVKGRLSKWGLCSQE